MSDKLELSEVLSAVDSNIKELWDALDETGQRDLKKLFYTLNRYISNVSAPLKKWPSYVQSKYKTPTREEQEHYVVTVNEFFNKNWTVLQNHPKLLWHLLCMCNHKTDSKKQFYHEWIGLNKTTVSNKKVKLLAELYPTAKIKDLEVLAKLTPNDELIALAQDYGMVDVEKKLK